MVLVSACLLGINCRYDGSNNLDKRVLDFLAENGNFVAICPEILGGLHIPRGPYEIMGGTGEDVINGRARLISDKGEDVTREFIKGAEESLKIAKRNSIKMAILKSKSPSCGVKLIYDGTFSHTIIEGDGVTAALLRREGIDVVEDGLIGL